MAGYTSEAGLRFLTRGHEAFVIPKQAVALALE